MNVPEKNDPFWSAQNGFLDPDDWKILETIIDRLNIKNVVEFGSGISTRLFHMKGLNALDLFSVNRHDIVIALRDLHEEPWFFAKPLKDGNPCRIKDTHKDPPVGDPGFRGHRDLDRHLLDPLVIQLARGNVAVPKSTGLLDGLGLETRGR